MSFETINPATGRRLRVHEEHSRAEVETRLALAAERFAAWRQTSDDERARLLRGVAAVLRAGKVRYAATITAEMGKPIAAAEAEVEKCATACDHYAEHARRYLAIEPAPSDARESFVRYDPIGPVLAIMPWNFPFWQVFRFCAPALAAGNVGLLKHASNVPECALAIEEALLTAGLPQGCFQSLIISSAAVGDIIADPRVCAVTLTGSEAAGARVAEAAGRAIKKTVLELGGSDPFVVLGDADIEKAVAAAATSRTINCGQSCIAAKRFIVHESVFAEFEARFTAAMARLRVGDPMDRSMEVGPLARGDLVDEIERQARESVEMGARLVCGGHRVERPGFFFEPTVLTDVRPGMPAWDEETFGPLAALAAARSDDDAIRLANATPYGLGASLWSRNIERAKSLAAKIDAGAVFVNGIVKSDPRLPFGGIKRSGHGRELARHGILEFVNAKTVWIG
jgi:succinate-semialdehyde dehydrogenase/glutarate-semialdehyde dehydrogenase